MRHRDDQTAAATLTAMAIGCVGVIVLPFVLVMLGVAALLWRAVLS